MSRPVLIVEDEPDLAGFLSDVLRSAGYEATVTTGTRAVDRSLELRPAAVVLDYVMPGLNGADVVERMRADLGADAPPFILVTGLANARELAAEMRVQAFLRKPFDVDRFLQTVEELAPSGS